MRHHDAIEHQIDRGELLVFEHTPRGQAQFLDRLRAEACAKQQPALLTDPSGRVLACAGFDGVLHQLASIVVGPVEIGSHLTAIYKERPEHCSGAPEPGFYATSQRTFYVNPRLRVFVVRIPEVGWILQPIYALPEGVEEVDLNPREDDELLALKNAADSLVTTGH
jgi:hypothetical protein